MPFDMHHPFKQCCRPRASSNGNSTPSNHCGASMDWMSYRYAVRLRSGSIPLPLVKVFLVCTSVWMGGWVVHVKWHRPDNFPCRYYMIMKSWNDQCSSPPLSCFFICRIIMTTLTPPQCETRLLITAKTYKNKLLKLRQIQWFHMLKCLYNTFQWAVLVIQEMVYTHAAIKFRISGPWVAFVQWGASFMWL